MSHKGVHDGMVSRRHTNGEYIPTRSIYFCIVLDN